MPSSWMLCRVALVRTDGSEERNISIIKVTRIGELGKLAISSNRRTLRRNTLVTLKMEVLGSSETLVLTRSTWRNIPEDGILHSYRREDLKFYTILKLISTHEA
jgi:hypothetical protein